jgi:hypothetical protein
MKRIRSHLSFANVMSMIAVFAVLGGSAFAVSKKINGKKIKKASIAGSKLKKDTVTGDKINESTLVGVTKCPTGAPNRANNVCFGSQQPVSTDWDVAMRDCASKGLRIPSQAEALLVTNQLNTGDTYLWTEEFVGSGTDRVIIRTNDAGFTRIASSVGKGPQANIAYVCVATPA